MVDAALRLAFLCCQDTLVLQERHQISSEELVVIEPEHILEICVCHEVHV